MMWLVFSTAQPVRVLTAFMTSFVTVAVILFAQVASAQAPVKYVSAQEGMSAVFPAQFHATDAGEGCHEAELLVQHLDASSSSGFQTPGASSDVNTRLFMVSNCTDPRSVAAPWALTVKLEIAHFNEEAHTTTGDITEYIKTKVNGYDAVRCALEGTSHGQKFTGIWLMVKRGDQMVMAMAIHSASMRDDKSVWQFIDSFQVTEPLNH
ncbi:MAG: hypothetical protein ACREQ5_07665 [Candidatus Dormibacteria bacterium]